MRHSSELARGLTRTRAFRWQLILLCLYVHLAHSPLFAQNRAQAPEPQDQTSQPLPGGRISGRVLRADTLAPLAKAVITLWIASNPRESLSVRTDSSGSFDFKDVPPGTYRLRAQRNGYVAEVYGQKGGGPGILLTVGPGEKLSAREFRLNPSGVISGTVLDEDRDPVEGLSVTALRLRFSAGGKQRAVVVRNTVTDDEGNYRLPGLSPGLYYVQASGRGEAIAISTLASAFSYGQAFHPGVTTQQEASRVQVVSGQQTRGVDIVVRSTATFTISGVIVDKQSASNTTQYSVGFARGGGTAMGSANSDGSFKLRGLTPGEYLVVARISDEGKPSRRGFANVRLTDSDVRIAVEVGRTSEIRGKARMDKAELYKFAELRVVLIPDSEDGVAGGATIAGDGQFTIRDIPSGNYRFQLSGRESELYLREVRCGGEDFTGKQISLDPEKTVDECGLILSEEVGEVAGNVVDDNKPAEGHVVVLIPQSSEERNDPRRTMVGQTDANGQFRIAGIIPGEYFVFAVPPSDDAIYFDREFADRNQDGATRLTLNPKQLQSLKLKPTKAR